MNHNFFFNRNISILDNNKHIFCFFFPKKNPSSYCRSPAPDHPPLHQSQTQGPCEIPSRGDPIPTPNSAQAQKRKKANQSAHSLLTVVMSMVRFDENCVAPSLRRPAGPSRHFFNLIRRINRPRNVVFATDPVVQIQKLATFRAEWKRRHFRIG